MTRTGEISDTGETNNTGDSSTIDVSNRPLQPREQAIMEILNSLAGKAISGHDLAHRLGVKQRNLRVWIARLRLDRNLPIMSSPEGGYWLPQSTDDVKAFGERMMRYGRDYFAIAGRVRRTTADVIAGQFLLDMFPVRPSATHDKAWEMFLSAGRRRINVVDVLGQTFRLMRESPELFSSGREQLERDYDVIILSPEEARKFRTAQELLGGIRGRLSAAGN